MSSSAIENPISVVIKQIRFQFDAVDLYCKGPQYLSKVPNKKASSK